MPEGNERSPLLRSGMLVGGALLFMVIGGYVYLTWDSTPRIDAEAAINVLNHFRELPSNEGRMSVDERLDRELQTSRESGRLVRYQGWTFKPVSGARTKILVVFSFEEENGEQRAEWLADTVEKTFVPQTTLAMEVFSGEAPSNN